MEIFKNKKNIEGGIKSILCLFLKDFQLPEIASDL